MVKKGGDLMERAKYGLIGKTLTSPSAIKAVVTGKTGEPPVVTKMLQKYGNAKLMYIKVNRQPVQAVVQKMLNFFSKDRNNFKKELAKTPYDDIYHLSMQFKTDKGRVLLEKNDRINMTEKPHEVETMDVQFPQGLTIRQIYDNAYKKMGKDFFPYSSRYNNCQNFVLNLLQASGLSTPELELFVKQDVDNIFQTDPRLQKIANTFTDLGARVNVLTEGGTIQTRPKGRPPKYSVRPIYPPESMQQPKIDLSGKGLSITQIKAMSQKEREKIAKQIAIQYGLDIAPIIQGKGVHANDLSQIMEQGYKKKGQMKDIGNYKLDKELSGQRAQVYYNSEKNDVLVNHRGTASAKDVLTDAMMGVGGLYYYPKTKRFDHAKTVQDQARAKYKGSNMISTGHSLGSQLSKHSSKPSDEVIGYNGAYLPYNLIHDKKYKKLTNVKSQDDPVNALHYLNNSKSKKQKNIVIKNDDKTSILGSHGVANLKKIDKNKYIGF
jgi:hypothetical protein